MTEYKQHSIDAFDKDVKALYVGQSCPPLSSQAAEYPEVSSASLGAEVLSCSDDFFASKDNLIKLAVSYPS
jgi:allantoicase